MIQWQLNVSRRSGEIERKETKISFSIMLFWDLLLVVLVTKYNRNSNTGLWYKLKKNKINYDISCRIFQSSYKFYKHEVPTKARNNRTGKSAVTGTNNNKNSNTSTQYEILDETEQ